MDSIVKERVNRTDGKGEGGTARGGPPEDKIVADGTDGHNCRAGGSAAPPEPGIGPDCAGRARERHRPKTASARRSEA